MITTTLVLLTSMNMLLFSIFMHPLMMICVLIMQTVLTFSVSMTMQSSSWNSYIIFLIMVGGLLIIFSYLSALIPNEVFYGEKKVIVLLVVVMVLTTQTVKNISLNTNNMILNFAYQDLNKMIMMLLSYFLMSLFVIMFLTNQLKHPLKQ